jgi:hypothetical protein
LIDFAIGQVPKKAIAAHGRGEKATLALREPSGVRGIVTRKLEHVGAARGAAFLHASSLLGAALLLLTALGAETIDGAGNSLFLRAVHPYKRAEMTAVYATYRDLAQFAPPAFFALLLSMFDLASVFVAAGAMMLLLAIFARYVSRNI